MSYSLVQPNPVEGRALRPPFFNGIFQFVENLMAANQLSYGLLRTSQAQSPVLASLDSHDLIKLNSIHAIGERGHLISSDSVSGGPEIAAYDCSNLPVGTHRIFACLSHDRIPCGEGVEAFQSGGGRDAVMVESFQHNQVKLAADDDRLVHRDWLRVAEVERIRDSGFVRTNFNRRYHPPVSNMSAYQSANPIATFLTQIEERLRQAKSGPLTTILSTELAGLRVLATNGHPLSVFVSLQRCLSIMSSVPEFAEHSSLLLRDYSYTADSFCSFLEKLRDYLSDDRAAGNPDMLLIEGKRFHLLDGEFIEEGDFWIWKSSQNGFVANEIALYFPRTTVENIPIMRFGTQIHDQSQCAVARKSEELIGPGTAIIFGDLKGTIENILISSDSVSNQQSLRLQLGEGHAVYYR